MSVLNERITVRVREVYGRRLIYPVCERAKIFAELTGQKTLTDKAVEKIKKLGFGLTIVPETLEGGSDDI